MTYDFIISPPVDTISTSVNGRMRDGAPMITANFSAVRHDLTDARLLRALFRFPLMTLKVVLAIHWEAVRLIAKGLRIRPEPPRPDRPVSVVPPVRSSTVTKPSSNQPKRGTCAYALGARQDSKAPAMGDDPHTTHYRSIFLVGHPSRHAGVPGGDPARLPAPRRPATNSISSATLSMAGR